MNATEPDPAAEFAAAMSLYINAETRADATKTCLSKAYEGHDELMRVCMKAGRAFEAWCCRHVDWNVGIADVWPYLLEDKFGTLAVDSLELPDGHLYLDRLNETHFRRIARKLKLPLYRT